MESVYLPVGMFGVCRLGTSRWTHGMMKTCDLISLRIISSLSFKILYFELVKINTMKFYALQKSRILLSNSSTRTQSVGC